MLKHNWPCFKALFLQRKRRLVVRNRRTHETTHQQNILLRRPSQEKDKWGLSHPNADMPTSTNDTGKSNEPGLENSFSVLFAASFF